MKGPVTTMGMIVAPLAGPSEFYEKLWKVTARELEYKCGKEELWKAIDIARNAADNRLNWDTGYEAGIRYMRGKLNEVKSNFLLQGEEEYDDICKAEELMNGNT